MQQFLICSDNRDNAILSTATAISNTLCVVRIAVYHICILVCISGGVQYYYRCRRTTSNFEFISAFYNLHRTR